jgi:hypothetical protein
MDSVRRTTGRAILVALALTASWAMAQTPDPEVWVLGEKSGEVWRIDPSLFTVKGSFFVGDPDLDGTIEAPRDLAFSTLPSAMGTHAFVVQERYLTVIDVATRTVVGTPHDIAVLLDVGHIDLEGCAPSVPRSFRDVAGGEVLRTYLHLAGTLGTGEAYFVVLDQAPLVAGTISAPAGDGALASGAEALDVTVLETPSGPRHQRAWYSVRRSGAASDEVLVFLVATGDQDAGTWQVEDSRSWTLPMGQPAPQHLRLGAPRGRELPVLPLGGLGRLENLDTGDFCDTGGNLVAATVTGVGPDAYAVHALDPASDRILAIDPTNCQSSPFTTGANPVDLVPDGLCQWQQVFSANRDDDSITVLRFDETSEDLTLPGGGQPCVICPVAIGKTQTIACAIEEILVTAFDEDGDDTKDDVHLEWEPVGCPQLPVPAEYKVLCQCADEASVDCPCYCEFCNDPGCFCGDTLGGSLTGSDLFLQGPWPPGDDFAKNPWKSLGKTTDTSFDHLNVGADLDDLYYDLALDDGP